MTRRWTLKLRKEKEKEIIEEHGWPSQKSLHMLVKLYMGQIKRFVPIFYRSPDSMREDVIQEAYLTLLKYGNTFNPSRGSFCTLANMLLERELLPFVKRNRTALSFSKNSQDSQDVLSVDRKISKDGTKVTFLETMQSETKQKDMMFWNLMERCLSQREKKVIGMRLKGYFQEEIGNELGVTNSRIQQIENIAHKKIKKKIQSYLFEETSL